MWRLEDGGTDNGNDGAHQYPGEQDDDGGGFPDAPGAGPFVAVQQCGAGACGRGKEGQMHTHDNHDDRQFRTDTEVGAVAEDNGHESHAHGTIIDELSKNGGQQTHAQREEQRQHKSFPRCPEKIP